MEKNPEPKDIAVFVEVARQKSLSRAAAVLQLPNSHVSRRLKNLENALGCQLIERTTRHFKLTDVGENYAALCADAFVQLAVARDYVESLKGEPQGLVRLLVPFEFGLHLCKSFLYNFSRQYPKVTLEMVLKNRATNEDYASFDAFLEVGQVLAPPSFFQKKFLVLRRRLYATPEFAQEFPVRSPEELPAGRMIALVNERGNTPASNSVLVHRQSGKQFEIKDHGTIRINSPTGMKHLALSGAGICFVVPFLVEEELASGRLVPILEDWHSMPIDLYLTFGQDKKRSPRVECLLHSLLGYAKAMSEPQE